MKSFLKTTFVLLFVALFAFGCEDSFNSLVDERLEENPVPDQSVSGDAGSADFSNYVAIGNSLTAGFMDGALYNAGQENSLAALLAEQFTYAGAPDQFNQPDINSELGFNTSVDPNPQNGTILGRYKLDTSIPGPSPTIGGDQIDAYSGNTSDLNNFGVPGILVGQLLTPATGGPTDPGDGSVNPAYNPFYQRFASNPSQDGSTGSTILNDAISAEPSFFTLWIGSNDVLGYAISGASNPAIFTSQNNFNTQYNGAVNALLSSTSASGVLVTIPPVTVVPYFQAVPWNAIELTATEAEELNQGLASVNAALDAVASNFPNRSQEDMDARKINYEEGANPILVNDPALPDLGAEFDQLQQAGAISAQQRAALAPYEQSRPLTENELVTLSAGAVLGTEYDGDSSNDPTTIGAIIPLGFPNPQNADLGCTEAQGDECYLTVSEQNQINTRAGAFNQIIAQAAQSSDRLALYDITAGFPGNPNTTVGAFADLFGMDGEVGINIGGQTLQPDFSPNGVFSTDGIHPNQRGNAILANEIIDVIESNFGASIPDVDVLNLPSVQVCAGNCVSQQSKQKPLVGKIKYNSNLAR